MVDVARRGSRGHDPSSGEDLGPEFPALRSLEARARRARAAERTVHSLVPVLVAGLVGVLLLLAGLAWDALVHASDPEAAHVETSLFSFGNRSHIPLVIGGGLVVASVTLAAMRVLSLSRTPWVASPWTGGLVAVTVLGGSLATTWALDRAAKAELPLATGSLAPTPGPDNHGIGVLNSHAPGECRPTKAQRAAAEKLVADTASGTARYQSLEVAMADGYVGPTTPIVPGSTEHFSSSAAVLDGKVLDPSRPESLLYTFTPRGAVLIGVMYLTNHPGEFGPEVGGCLTRWHVHTNVCWSVATLQPVRELEPGETCGANTFLYIPPPALHVWLADVPGGRFAAEVEADDLLRVASRG